MISADARTGSTVGKYRLHEIVGRGGMGVVYRAEHVYIGREVAVKILHEGYGGREESIKRFLREARAASLINHPNIVEVTDFGKANDGTVFFVMELLVGEPLDNILARDRRLDLLRSIIICNQLAAALAAAHGKGIIHRDLKPENVMLIPREGRRELVRRVSDESGDHELSEREKRFDFVKILDFGVAKVREPEPQKGRVTKAGVVFGTPEYMAPETARVGFSDARSDIYALGVMFYEMLTGTVPFTGDTPVEVMMKQVHERVPPMHEVAPDAEVTDEAERMILKALAKDPELRQQNMEEFHRDLQKCYGQLRFRRTLKTPTVSITAVTTIPLTKKKKAAPGAIPASVSAGSSSPGEIDTTAPAGRQRTMTPKLPGLPGNVAAPILLTKRKAARAGRNETLPVQPGRDSGAYGQLEIDLVTSRATPPAAPRMGQASGDARRTPDPEAQPEKKKRTTLPLGLEQEAARLAKEAARTQAPTTQTESATPAASGGAARGTKGAAAFWTNDVEIPQGTAAAMATVEETAAPPDVPALPRRGTDVAAMMISVPQRPPTGPVVPIAPERPTPRLSMVATADVEEASWSDEPTAPSLKTGGT